MTIQEYDSKADVRRRLAEIDNALEEMENISLRHGSKEFRFLGIGPISNFNCSKVAFGVNDPQIFDDFKRLLLKRKQELIDQFVG